MDIKVNNMTPVQQVETPKETAQADGSFKFMLASQIAETELQERLASMMEEITMQGDKLAKHRDIKDMRKYRSLIKSFMNEVIT